MMNKMTRSDARLDSARQARFVFFGTGEIARYVLEELGAAGFFSAAVVTEQDRPRGRGLQLAPTPTKQWAAERNIPVLQPSAINAEFLEDVRLLKPQLAIVVDYGTFIPRQLLDIPARGCLNMHPSLLPRLRGPSPIRSAILRDEKTVGVSIILLDEELDHGPIVAQKKVVVPEWPPHGKTLDELLAREGGKLLVQILPQWLQGEIEARPQNHDIATYSMKFKKEDGQLDLSADAYRNLLKVRAFEGWPGTFAMFKRSGKPLRVQILDAHSKDGKFVPDIVKPEGKREMPYEEFARSGVTPI